MGTSVYVKAYYTSIEKPFSLEVRHSHCGGTDWHTICRLDLNDAQTLVKEGGLSWWMSEPDWGEHFKKIKRMEAERNIRNAQKTIQELDAKEAG